MAFDISLGIVLGLITGLGFKAVIRFSLFFGLSDSTLAEKASAGRIFVAIVRMFIGLSLWFFASFPIAKALVTTWPYFAQPWLISVLVGVSIISVKDQLRRRREKVPPLAE